ncbi:hypothetical protein LI951_11270 [Enterococcus sp. BWT-B8]|uniref:MucBP domain-containing protein n=1 Tax=Enterococcus sp. BWT-B8 TaxID=2885157 RepID=UPI001E42CFAE|nr:hypothetical protein [Enterococcus sp. BWT-B8]MCB5952648.1 hypothetical protein [Enterococcus sp. BWT-B8]
MKNKTLKLGAGLITMVGLVLSGILYFRANSTINAAPITFPEGYSAFDQTNTPLVNILKGNSTDPDGNIVEVPGEYGTVFRLSDNTSYEVEGNTDYVVSQTVVRVGESAIPTNTKYYRFKPFSSTLPINEKPSVKIKNAGIYNGRSIDLKLVMDQIDITAEYVNFIAVDPADAELTNSDAAMPVSSSSAPNWGKLFLFLGSGNQTSSGNKNILNNKYSQGDSFDYHYEFYDSETNARIDQFKGTWNFLNINKQKAVSVEHSNLTDFSDIYIREYDTTSNNFIGIKKSTKNGESNPDFIELYAGGTSLLTPNTKLTKLVKGSEINMSVQFKNDTSGAMGITYDSNSLVRIAPSRPIVYGDRNSISNGNNGYMDLQYTIRQGTSPNMFDAANGIDNRNDKFEVQSEVPDYYDVDQNATKVYNYSTGADVTDLFTIEATGNKVRVIAKNPKSDEFDGEVFDIKVVAKPNLSFDFEANKDFYGYQYSGENNGYMTNFEMGGTKTQTVYSYSTKTEVALISLTPEEQVDLGRDRESQSQVRYDGIPYADAREDILYPKGTKFAALTESQILSSLIKNVHTDTGNTILDEPVSVSVDISRLPDTTVPGEEVTVYVILTTPQGVTKEVPVKVAIGETQADVTVHFVDDQNQTIRTSISITGEMIGQFVDLTQKAEVLAAIEEIKALGYDVQSRPPNETAVEVLSGGSAAAYVFVRSAAALTINFVDETGEVATPVVIPGKVADKIDLTQESDVTDQLTALTDAGYDIIQRPGTEDAVEITVGGRTVEYVLKKADATVKVSFIFAADFSDLKTPIILNKKVGDIVDLTAESSISNMVAIIESEGYTVISRPSNETALTVARGENAVSYTFVIAEAVLKVRFVDEQDADIRPAVDLSKSIGDSVDLTLEQTVLDAITSLETNGYDIITRPSNETGVEVVSGGSEVKYVLEKAKSTVIVEFVYLSRNDTYKAVPDVSSVTLSDREVGKTINLTQESSVITAISTIISKGRFTLSDSNRPSDESAVLVERTPKTVRYIFVGLLKLESVPTLDFRTQSIKVTDEVKVNDPSLIDNENYTESDYVDNKDKLIISDYRYSERSWTLSVKLISPLLPDEANPDEAYVLPDAIRYQTGNNELTITEDLEEIVTESYEGEYDLSSTWTPEGTGFKLELPAGSVNKLGKYKATMLYYLENTP